MYQLKFGAYHGRLNTLGDVLAKMNHFYNNSDVVPRAEEITLTKNGSALQVSWNSYGRYGVIQAGSGAAICEAMLDEVDRFYLRPHGKVLQPWQMLREQWAAANAIGSAAYDAYPCFTPAQRGERCSYTDREGQCRETNLSQYCEQLFFHRFGYFHNGPLYGSKRSSNSRHEVHVAYALAEGKPVPEAVIQQYREDGARKGKVDIEKWFQALLDVPALRGNIAPEKLATLVVVLAGDKMVLTIDNASFFIELMRQMPLEDPHYGQMDDYLYQNGVIKAKPVPLLTVVDLGQAFSPLALDLRISLGESRKTKTLKRLSTDHAAGRVTKRQFEVDSAAALQIPASESFAWANKIAQAVEERNLDALLDIFDTAADCNIVSKKVVCKAVGLKTLGVTAAQRRAAIFRFCGCDATQQAQYDQDLAAKLDAAQAERLRREATKRVEGSNYRIDGKELISAKEYVDRAVADGYSTIAVRMKGRVKQYWLFNPASNTGKGILAKNGTLAYARLVHGLPDSKPAA